MINGGRLSHTQVSTGSHRARRGQRTPVFYGPGTTSASGLRGTASEQLHHNSERLPLHSSFYSSARKCCFPSSPPPLISPSICCYSFFNSGECLGCCLNGKCSQNEGCLLEILFFLGEVSVCGLCRLMNSSPTSAQSCIMQNAI